MASQESLKSSLVLMLVWATSLGFQGQVLMVDGGLSNHYYVDPPSRRRFPELLGVEHDLGHPVL